MRMSRQWKIASLLSAVILLSSGDLCLLFTCAPQEARELAHHDSHGGCSDTGSSRDGEHGQGGDDCARPCEMSVTLASGPQLSAPRDAGSVTLLAVLPAPQGDAASFRRPIGRAPPGHVPSPPLSLLLDAFGVRGPPSA